MLIYLLHDPFLRLSRACPGGVLAKSVGTFNRVVTHSTPRACRTTKENVLINGLLEYQVKKSPLHLACRKESGLTYVSAAQVRDAPN